MHYEPTPAARAPAPKCHCNMYFRTKSIECPFCLSSGIQDRIIVDNHDAKAFLTYTPIVPGHILICPKRCVSSIDELEEHEILSIFNRRSYLKPILIRVFGAEGFNYAWNENTVAGQTIPHLHLHMLPRRQGDSGAQSTDPRRFFYRPDIERSVHSETDLRQLSVLLKEARQEAIEPVTYLP